MNLPNLLCVLRLIMAPVVAVLILRSETAWAAGLFAASAVTDAIDGYLARRWRQITLMGQMLDPLADKALINLSFLAAAASGYLPWWMALLVLGRDILILAGAVSSRIFGLGHDLLPLAIGKICTFLQMGLMLAILIAAAETPPAFVVPDSLGMAVTVATIASGVLYAASWLIHLLRSRQAVP